MRRQVIDTFTCEDIAATYTAHKKKMCSRCLSPPDWRSLYLPLWARMLNATQGRAIMPHTFFVKPGDQVYQG